MLTSRVRGILPAHDLIPIEVSQSADSRPPPTESERGFHNSGIICGVASLRGRDFPVVDLRGKLGIPHGSHGRQPCVVVVEVGGESGARLLGFVADRISEVLLLRDRDFRDGTVRLNGRTRRVLNPDLILTEEELRSSWNATQIASRHPAG